MNHLPRQVILATHNKHKVEELSALLAPLKIRVFSAADFPELPDVIEDGSTFEENAIKKAKEVAQFTGISAIADDSGLCVDALNGEPGIFSARYAGEHGNDQANNQKLLERMSDIPDDQRTAHFISVIAFANTDGSVHTFNGTCKGKILREARGSNGFGYDPLFYIPELGMTMAELSSQEKNRVSHRARAYQRFLQWLKSMDKEI